MESKDGGRCSLSGCENFAHAGQDARPSLAAVRPAMNGTLEQ